MTPNKPDNRIPADEIGEYSPWDLPTVKSRHVIGPADRGTKNPGGFYRNKDDIGRAEQVDVDMNMADLKRRALTARDLEQIADEAYQEGFKSGKADGHATGYMDGFAKGEAAGRQQAQTDTRAQVDAQMQRLEQVIGHLLEPIEAQDRQLETALLTMVKALAMAVTKAELQTDPRYIQAVVSEAVAALPVGAEQIKIFINSADKTALEQLRERGHHEWQIREDAALTPGGCRVETSHSLIDYSVEARLRQAVEQMLQARLQHTVSDDGSDEA